MKQVQLLLSVGQGYLRTKFSNVKDSQVKICSILLFAKSPLQNLWKDGRENNGAYVSDFFIRRATSKAHVVSSFLQKPRVSVSLHSYRKVLSDRT